MKHVEDDKASTDIRKLIFEADNLGNLSDMAKTTNQSPKVILNIERRGSSSAGNVIDIMVDSNGYGNFIPDDDDDDQQLPDFMQNIEPGLQPLSVGTVSLDNPALHPLFAPSSLSFPIKNAFVHLFTGNPGVPTAPSDTNIDPALLK